jgi:hypothetical protein
MELRIFCQRGSCENMLRAEARFGCKVKDILDRNGWKKINDINICKECLQIEQDRAEFHHQKTA